MQLKVQICNNFNEDLIKDFDKTEKKRLLGLQSFKDELLDSF